MSCGRFVARALLATGAGNSVDSAAAAVLRRQHHLMSALSGFPKNLRFGPSGVLRKDGFGDDACFIARHSTADVVGVADGVGGWRTYGIDPSIFPRSLMKVCSQLVSSGNFEPSSPADLIAASYRLLEAQMRSDAEEDTGAAKLGRTKRSLKRRPLVGSSTACVVVLDRVNNRIHTANIGDSGFLVVRYGKVVHRSHEQQHYFNAPFQLSLPLNDESSRFLSDSPDTAETTSFEVQEGDLIIVATDGLFDNMPTNLIENTLKNLQNEYYGNIDDENISTNNISDDVKTDSKNFEADEDESEKIRRFLKLTAQSLQQACNAIAFQARQLAMDMNHMSPFAQKAQENGIHDFKGGKPDDITLILALVTSQNLECIYEESEPQLSSV